MLDLSCSQLVEAALIANLREAQGIEKAKRLNCTELCCWIKWGGWRHLLRLHLHGRDILGCFCHCEEGQLLNGVLACSQLSCEDTKYADHGHAAVVDLLVAHLNIVHVNTEGVAEVAWLLALLLSPCQLKDAADSKQDEHAEGCPPTGQCAKCAVGSVEPRELHEWLADRTNRCHHRNSAMLDLSCSQLVEAALIANLREAQGIEKAKRLNCTELCCWIKWGGCWWRCWDIIGTDWCSSFKRGCCCKCYFHHVFAPQTSCADKT